MDSFDPLGVLKSDEYALPPQRFRPRRRSFPPEDKYEHTFCYSRITCGEGGPMRIAFSQAPPPEGGGLGGVEKGEGGPMRTAFSQAPPPEGGACAPERKGGSAGDGKEA